MVDSGVDLQHEDLQCPGKIVVPDGADVIEDGKGPDDVRGHGTHVAGIVAACTGNGTGISGVAPGVTLLPYQVFDANNQGTFGDIATAIQRATDAGAHVINLSLGPELSINYPGTYLPGAMEDVDAALTYARSKGVVVVAAAGNHSFPLCQYPALYDDVLCVGSTDSRGAKAWYSNFPVKLDENGPAPAVVAPGGSSLPFCDFHAEAIFSLYPREKDNCEGDGRPGYRDLSGTSMATPHVAGVAALVYARVDGVRTAAHRTFVIDAILQSARDLGPLGYDPAFGYGAVDAAAAVAIAPPMPPGGMAPSAPGSPAARSPRSRLVALTWTDTSNNEDGFVVERSPDGTNFAPAATLPVNSTSFEDASVNANSQYHYRVKAFNAGGSSPYSPVVAVSTLGGPTGLTATETPAGAIQLTWVDGSTAEAGFKIERSRAGGEFSEIGTAGASSTSFVDSAVAPGTAYAYRVRAYTSSASSDYSETASLTTRSTLAAPSGLTVTRASQSEIEIGWTDNSANEEGFEIERSTDGVTFTQIDVVPRDVRSYVDDGLASSTTYHYRVRAYHGSTRSAYSNAVFGVTSGGGASAPPAAPVSLTATPVSASAVDLVWEDGSGDEDAIRIERSADGGPFVEVAVVGDDWPSSEELYTDRGLSPETTYRYRVRAYNAAGTSGYSPEAQATTGRDPEPGPLAPRVGGNGFASSPTVFFYHYGCVATALNGIAEATRVSDCWLEDRYLGRRTREIVPVTSSGPVAVATGVTAGRGAGGTERWTRDVWLCWRISAYFTDNVIVEDRDCVNVS